MGGTQPPEPAVQQWIKAAAAALVGYAVTGVTSAGELARVAFVGVLSGLAYFFCK